MSPLPDSARWHALDAALGELLELEPAERPAWFAAHCTGRPDFALELARLLQCADDEGLLERLHQPALLARAFDGHVEGERIGEWQLLRRIGMGGMADVFLAARDSGGVRQFAALKRMATGLGSPELRTRFARERDILARLSDARIARYFDGGIADDGRPWLAMERVEGLPIDRHCEQHRLPLRARLALFREVCGAVAHAHRHLVVHRDIKPSNVLVSEEGQVKLLDFGIAKALEEGDGGSTGATLRLLTPRYASPEQLRGEAASTATDVFLLGLLLHELLVGRRPFARHEEDPFALERALREEEAPRLSDALSERLRETPGAAPPVRARELRGDLERIAALALRKDPARRYPSVERLDEDVARFLQGRPIAAHGDAFGYRFGKWLSRHRLAGAALAVALLVALGSAATLLRQNRIVGEQRDRARASAAQAEAVRDFLLGLFAEADPAKALGAKLSVGAVLERGSARVADGFETQPRVRAEMLQTIGVAWHGLGDHARARALLSEAVVLRRQWPQAGADLARSLAALAAVERDDSRLEQGIALAREALLHAGDDPQARALALNELGVGLLLRDTDLDAARLALGDAITAFHAWTAPDPQRIAIAQGNLAAVDLGQGRLDAAEAGFAGAIEVLAPRLGDVHPEVTALLYNLARLQERRGEFALAEANFTRVLAAETRVYGAGHPDVAIDRTRLAYVQAARGDHEAAERGFAQALQVLRAKLPADHKRIAENLMGYAESLVERGHASQAEPLAAEAIAILAHHFADDDWRVADARRIQSRAWLRLHRTDEAIAQLQRVGPALLAQPPPLPQRYRAALAEATAR
jgi:tetratricopeptide (TPR) repeat protein